jgi:hypothetical protein
MEPSCRAESGVQSGVGQERGSSEWVGGEVGRWGGGEVGRWGGGEVGRWGGGLD